MKIMFPKEMKIRTAVNFLSIILAIVDVIFALILIGKKSPITFYDILALIAACLYFLEAKFMWALKKKIKEFSKVFIAIILVLGLLGTIPSLISPSVNMDILVLSIVLMSLIIGSAINSSIGLWAEKVLIEKKFLVYSK
ncbi:MAG: hypothetical protein ACTSVI_01695 [Promethearchaeota archaeon]